MTTTKKPAGADAPETGSRRQQIVGWAELGVETAASAQKQLADITFAYTDLALKAWRDSLSWVESYNEQSRKTIASLAHARTERAKAVLDRLS